MLLGSLMGILMVILNFKDLEDYAWFLLLVMPIAAAMGYFFIHASKKLKQAYEEFSEEIRKEQEEEKAAHQKYLQEHPYLEAEEFFMKARDAGIPNLDSKANVSRLLLYAKNNGITTPKDKLIEEFNLGRQYVERHEAIEQAQQEHDRLEELREQEEALYERYTYYAHYTEQSKSIHICQDKIREAENIIYQCERDEESVKNGGEATYLLGHQKESSWAVHGGIASGIAGGAAGVAVAIDTERRNQQKRQQNANLASSVAALSVMQLEKIWDRKRGAQSDLDRWTAKLNEAKVLLCEKLNQSELLAMLHPSVENFEITETGAVKLNVKLHSTPNLIIFDEIKAVVDGSIEVLLKVDGEVVGSAVCVLPYGGMTNSATAKCICCKPEKQAKEYTFDFSPNHLWAVETKAEVYDSWGREQERKAKEAEQKIKQAELCKKIAAVMAGDIAVTKGTKEYVDVLTIIKEKGPLDASAIISWTEYRCPKRMILPQVNRILETLEVGKLVHQSEVNGKILWEYK